MSNKHSIAKITRELKLLQGLLKNNIISNDVELTAQDTIKHMENVLMDLTDNTTESDESSLDSNTTELLSKLTNTDK